MFVGLIFPQGMHMLLATALSIVHIDPVSEQTTRLCPVRWLPLIFDFVKFYIECDQGQVQIKLPIKIKNLHHKNLSYCLKKSITMLHEGLIVIVYRLPTTTLFSKKIM